MNIIKVDELYHYGVPGMKWGVRHDKTLTEEQNRQRRKEIREDNKKAFELGKGATVYGRALKYATRDTARAEKIVDKIYEKNGGKPSKLADHFRKNWEQQAETTMRIAQKYKVYEEAGKKHCEEMKKKYGVENVTDIKYKSIKLGPMGNQMMVNEKVSSGKDWLKSAAITGASTGLNALGMPFAVLAFPSGKTMRGYDAYMKEQMQTSRSHKR